MYDVYFKGQIKRNCKSLCKKVIGYFNDNPTISNYTFKDEILKTINCQALEKEIKIEFISLNGTITIFKKPVLIKVDDSTLEIFDEENLKKLIDDHNDQYLFYTNDEEVTPDFILKNRPSIVYLITKKSIEFECFNPLNEKDEIPKKANTIVINTCKLTPIDLKSLNLMTNDNFEVSIKDRYELFDILDKFLISKNQILKVYGSDGIGKSITFVYYTHLKNKYKIVYFNLKEIFIKLENEQWQIMMHQLLNFFTVENKEEIQNNNIELYKAAFADFNDKIKEIEIYIYKSDNFNFWEILLHLIKSKFFNENTLLILDQYKSENDKHNHIHQIQDYLLQKKKNNIKILISSSINDAGVKYDFEIDLLAISQLHKNKIIDNNMIEKNFSEKNKKNELIRDLLPNKDKEWENNKSKLLNSMIFNQRKKLFETNLIQVVYISKLVSVENLNENVILKENIKDFEYNPKYFYKYKKDFLNVYPKITNEKIYANFCKTIYELISTKITKFYHNHIISSDDNSTSVIDYIVNVQNIIKNENIYNLEGLIKILNEIPLKYIKIIKIEEDKNEIMENNINNKGNIIIFNSDIINSRFKLDYSFPFIKYVFARLNFDLEVINLNHFSPSGIGSIIEESIKKALFTFKNYGEFCYRVVYSLKFTDKNEIRKKQESLPKDIDIFNFKMVNYDDLFENLFWDYTSYYYIAPKISNNEALDSIILIPPKIFNPNRMEYWLIALQITISKNKAIKSLHDYSVATIDAAKLLEKIYKIKIINKYFLFVLLKESETIKTQNSLQKNGISYIYFSSTTNKFYDKNGNEIIIIRNLINNEYIIIDDPIEKEIIRYKSGYLYNLQTILYRKRGQSSNPITDEEYYSERKKIFTDDEPINLPRDIKNKIHTKMANILKTEKQIQIRYAFISPFYKIDYIIQETDLFGLIFFKSKIYIYYKDRLYDINEENDKDTKGKSELDIHIYKALNNEILINDGFGQTYNKEKKYELLIKYNQNKPSSIYVYWINDI